MRLGAVNMDVHKQFGSQYGVKGFPSLKWFGLDKSKSPLDFNGGRDADSMIDYALTQIKKNVKDRQSGKSKPNNKKKEGGSGSSSGSRNTGD